MLTPSWPTEDPAGVSVSALRRIQAGMVARSVTGNPRVGVLPDTLDPLVVGTSDPAMTYRVGPFVAVTSRSGVGAEIVSNDSDEFVSTDISPQANSRIDVIWLRSQFTQYGDAQFTPVIGVARGVPNANPQKPAIPSGALELATSVVTSSDITTETCVISQTCKYTAAAGGVVRLRNQTDMSAWLPADGAVAYRLDLGVLAVRENGAWAYEQTGTYSFAETFYALHSAYESLTLTRRGSKSRLRGTFTTTGAVNFNANQLYTVATIPAGWRPKSSSQGFCPIVLSATPTVWGWARVTSAGLLQIWLSAAASSATGPDGMVVSVDMEWLNS